MTDELQLLLRQGATQWNAWRASHPHASVSLHGADLSGADLNLAHLSGANMSGANLRGAQLIVADLSEADATSPLPTSFQAALTLPPNVTLSIASAR